MKTPEEIARSLYICSTPVPSEKGCKGCAYINEPLCYDKILKDAAKLILPDLYGDEIEHKPVKSYWSNITEINERQEEKGRAKYGEDLEDNTTLTTAQRIEHAQEEAIDLLKYLEHLKQVTDDGITANDYQRAALRTASGMNYEHHGMLMNGILGLCGETGEVADIVKKATFQGHDLDKEHVAEELGDVAWYLAVSAYAIGYNLGDIFQGNVDKLKKRYPDGFDKSRSINREEST